MGRDAASEYQTRPLDAETWDDFAGLVDENGGVWGGCWCLWYHGKAEAEAPLKDRRALKEARVKAGQAHAMLVYRDGKCVGWCQFGKPAELPRLHNARAYEKTLTNLPDWRITCFFSGKGHRGGGVASAALSAAVQHIKAKGGGRVEGYPEDIAGRKATPAFLFNGALHMFERLGFQRSRKIGKHKWVVTLDL
ncbi:MAG: GNAT family N-acetyltransferase [Pseudomonadota bacterium]